MQSLRKYMHKIIIAEAMKSPSSVSSDFAIWTEIHDPYDIPGLSFSTEINFVMYNTKTAYSLMEMNDSIQFNVRDFFNGQYR